MLDSRLLTYNKILYVPDAHVEPGQNLTRFKWVRDLIRKYRKELTAVIVDGDLWEMNSLCSQASAKELENKKVEADIKCGHDALKIIEEAKFTGKKFILGANHPHRIDRWISKFPSFEGMFSTKKDLYRKGWTYVPYEGSHPGTLKIGRTLFAHYFNWQGKSTNGAYPWRLHLKNWQADIVFGHHHTRGMEESVNAYGERNRAICAGAFLDPEWLNDLAYPGSSKIRWWNGVLMLGPDYEDWWSYTRLQNSFG